MFSVSALLLDDALKTATPLTNQTLRQFAPLSDDRLFQLVDCCGLSVLICHLLKAPKQHNRPDLSPGCLGATCQARSTLITQFVSVVAGLSAMSDISRCSAATHMRCGGSLVIALVQIFC